MLTALTARGLVSDGERPAITAQGRDWFAGFGLSLAELEKTRRPVCKHCLDWSERRHHLAGGLGAAMLDELLRRDWLRRSEGRALEFTTTGRKAFAAEFLA